MKNSIKIKLADYGQFILAVKRGHVYAYHNANRDTRKIECRNVFYA